MIGARILDRIVRLRTPNGGGGTGFVADHNDGTFIFTAAHVIAGLHAGSPIGIDAMRVSAQLTISKSERRGDAGVFAVRETIVAGDMYCQLDGAFHFGEDVFLFGYPAGQARHVDVLPDDAHKPKVRHMMPFARKGIISNMEQQGFVVDTLLQKGFSGGPVIRCADSVNNPSVIGIISGGLLFDDDRKLLDDDRGVTIRSGFTDCMMIRTFKEIVEDLF
jgi:hypothetical protein